MRLIVRLLINTALILILSSCAGWRSEHTLPVGKYPEKFQSETNKPKISFKLKKYEYFDNDVLDKEKSSTQNMAQVSKMVEDVYKDSNIFNMVDEDSPNKEMSIEVEITRKHKAGIGMTVVSALTLFLVPRGVSEEIVVTTRFLNKKGELIGMVEKNDDIVTWYQTFMLFATPFMYPNSIKTETIKDLNRASLIEAHSDGYFIDINS